MDEISVNKRGGIRKGQGRKPLADGQITVRVNLTMTATQRAKLAELGGAAWVRGMIDAATVSRNSPTDTPSAD